MGPYHLFRIPNYSVMNAGQRFFVFLYIFVTFFPGVFLSYIFELLRIDIFNDKKMPVQQYFITWIGVAVIAAFRSFLAFDELIDTILNRHEFVNIIFFRPVFIVFIDHDYSLLFL